MFAIKPKDKNNAQPGDSIVSAPRQGCFRGAGMRRRPDGAGLLGGHQSGFTIIEVLIVLAIAGLILIVIFLAVPAVQRSGRNNALNTDARSILAGVNTFASQNANSLPTTIAFAGGSVTIGASGSNQEVVKVDNATVNVLLNGSTITAGALGSPVGTVQIVTGTSAVCNATASGLNSSGGASPSATVALYVAESGSGNILKCIGN